MANWIDCIRSRGTPNAPPEIGYRSAMAVHMANLSYKKKQRITLEEARAITPEYWQSREAAKECSPRRKPWVPGGNGQPRRGERAACADRECTVPLSRIQGPMIGAVDIGGTKIAVGIVDDNGKVLARTQAPTDPDRYPTACN